METRSLTMATSEASPLFRKIFFLIGKLGLVVFFTMAVGWGYGYALLKANLFVDIVHQISVVLMSAVFSGLLARALLHSDGPLISFPGAFIAMSASLIDLASLSAGRIGIQFIRANPNVVDWSTSWQLVLGVLVILLALNAWRKPAARHTVSKKTSAKTPSQNSVKTSSSRAKPARRSSRAKAFPSLRKLSKPIRSFFKTTTKKAAAIFSGIKSSSRSVVRRAAAIIPKKLPASPAHLPVVKFHRAKKSLQSNLAPAAVAGERRMPKTPHSPIHLVGREEHRCPYCLCVVSPSDPAGVVICPVCKTYHHKSCWDVTGTCQVPHIHE
ncbi:MAG: hypothetical protein AB9891_17870 [Anaerolineaceae bacterium]